MRHEQTSQFPKEPELLRLCEKLRRLSYALSGGPDISDLVNQVVITTAEVLNANASSLYSH